MTTTTPSNQTQTPPPAQAPWPDGLPALGISRIRLDLERWGEVVRDQLLDTLLSGAAAGTLAQVREPASTAPGELNRIERAVEVAEATARRAWVIHQSVMNRPLFERTALVLFYRDGQARRGADAMVAKVCGITPRQAQLFRWAGERAVREHVNGLRRGRG